MFVSPRQTRTTRCAPRSKYHAACGSLAVNALRSSVSRSGSAASAGRFTSLLADGELPVALTEPSAVRVGLPARHHEVDLVALAAVVGLHAHRDDVLEVPLGPEREV